MIYRLLFIFLWACKPTTQVELSEELGVQSLQEWHTQYEAAFMAAKQSNKRLLIYFRHPSTTPAKTEFETKTIPNTDIQQLLSSMVLAALPLDATLNQKKIIDYFPKMHGQHGWIMIDFSAKDNGYGQTTSEYPFIDWSSVASDRALKKIGTAYQPWTLAQFKFALEQDGTNFVQREESFAQKFSGVPPTTPQDNSTQPSSSAEQMLAENNRYRAQWKLTPHKLNPKLVAAAERHAKDMATHRLKSHTGSDGSSASSRVTASGYRFREARENVAVGQRDIGAVFDAWVNSSGHLANMQSGTTEAGFAMVKNANGIFWVSVYASP